MSHFHEPSEGKLVKVEVLQIIKPNELMIKSKRADLKALPKFEKDIRENWTDDQLYGVRDKIPEKNDCILVKNQSKWKGYRRGCVQRVTRDDNNIVFNIFLYDHGRKEVTTLPYISKMLPEHSSVRPYLYLLTVQAVYPTAVENGKPKWLTQAYEFVKYFVSVSDCPFGMKILTKPSPFHIVGDLITLDKDGRRKYHSTLGDFLRAKQLALDMKDYNKLLLNNSDITELKTGAIPNIYNKTTGQIIQFSPRLDPNGNAYLAKVTSKLNQDVVVMPKPKRWDRERPSSSRPSLFKLEVDSDKPSKAATDRTTKEERRRPNKYLDELQSLMLSKRSKEKKRKY